MTGNEYLLYLCLLVAIPILWRFVVLYVWIPIKLKANPLRVMSGHNYLIFDPNTLGPEVNGFFLSHVQALVGRGFGVIQYLTKPEAQKNLTSVVIYFINRQTGERCTVSSFYVTVNGVVKVRGGTAIITSRFADDSSIVTANNASVGVFRRMPGADGLSLPDVEVNLLLDIHRYRVQKLADGKQPILPAFGAEVEEMERREDETVEYQAKCGLAYFDAARQAYFKTWYGTFYMTWRHLWPFKQVLLAQKRRKATMALAEYRRSAGSQIAGFG